MLIQFNFKNYKSFRDETTIDLSATKITEFNNRITKVGKERILPVAAIYGANASGKSNVYSAFEFMTEYVKNSLHFGDDAQRFDENRPIPFLFDTESEIAESSFEVYFTIPNDLKEKTYNYGFCIGRDGITEEWLNSKAKTATEYARIFYRSEEELEFTGINKTGAKNIEVALDKQVLVVSLGAKLKVDICKKVRDWFLINRFSDFGDVLTSFVKSKKLPKDFIDDINVQNNVIKFFESFDDSIKGFEIEKINSDQDNKKPVYNIKTLHKKIGSDKFAKIPLGMESAGTLKMLALYPELQEVLENGGVYFIDELNARLHPLLVRNFVLTFLNPELNINHAQLLFTTHDSWQLSNDFLRRDEIWFTDKDQDGVSTLYSLADFVDEDGLKIRKDESYSKNYMLGKYGAIPSLKAIDMLMEEKTENGKKRQGGYKKKKRTF